MDNAFLVVSHAFWSLLMAIGQGLFEVAQPTLEIFIPSLMAYLLHRFVRNAATAGALADAAGAAYLDLSSRFAAAGSISFEVAKRAAISAAVKGIDTAAHSALAKLNPEQLALKVGAKLGTLLASDSAFNVTDPLGKFAAAAAASSTLTITPIPAATPADVVAPVGVTPPLANFDLESMLATAVRNGLGDALKDVALTPIAR